MLNEQLRAELERRLGIIAGEQAEDPAFEDLPGADQRWLLVLLIAACVAVPIWQLL